MLQSMALTCLAPARKSEPSGALTDVKSSMPSALTRFRTHCTALCIEHRRFTLTTAAALSFALAMR